jgi:hypothetical protein
MDKINRFFNRIIQESIDDQKTTIVNGYYYGYGSAWAFKPERLAKQNGFVLEKNIHMAADLRLPYNGREVPILNKVKIIGAVASIYNKDIYEEYGDITEGGGHHIKNSVRYRLEADGYELIYKENQLIALNKEVLEKIIKEETFSIYFRDRLPENLRYSEEMPNWTKFMDYGSAVDFLEEKAYS